MNLLKKFRELKLRYKVGIIFAIIDLLFFVGGFYTGHGSDFGWGVLIYQIGFTFWMIPLLLEINFEIPISSGMNHLPYEGGDFIVAFIFGPVGGFVNGFIIGFIIEKIISFFKKNKN